MIGLIESSGIGVPIASKEARSTQELENKCVDHNEQLLKVLREDENSEWLFNEAEVDAKVGRMSAPAVWDGKDGVCLFHPRFAASQARPDGSIKLRAVDNFSWSPSDRGKDGSTNGFTVMQEKMTHDTIDSLAEASSLFVERTGTVPALLKADIDSAYRRIPVKKEHRWVAGVAFKAKGRAYKAMHYACPFGAAASSAAWERIGAAIAHIATFFLYLAILQYVDDFFGPERLETMYSALQCFARLVRALLGPDALAEDKLECGRGLCILGVDISMSWRGFQCRPAASKIPQWIALIEDALAPNGRLFPGLASKLAGKLSWGGAQLFHRLGRAMLRPIFDQKSKRSGRVCTELRRALLWWRDILSTNIAELKPWKQVTSTPVHMFCDAAGRKPYMGVVVFIDGECLWTHMVPPRKVMCRFRARSDNQIMGLELLAISLGLSTFERRLRGRKVIIHSDNSGSEVTYLVTSWRDRQHDAHVSGFSPQGSCTLVGPCAIGARTVASRRRQRYRDFCQTRCYRR